MSDNYNPYQTPTTDLGDGLVAANTEALFFTTGTAKFITMSVCTLGLYQVYWFYRNWALIQKRSPQKMVVWARSLFSVIYCYACFREIANAAKAAGLPGPLQAGPVATLYILLQLSSRLPDPYGAAVFLGFVPVLIANRAAMDVNASTRAILDPNTALAGWNWVAVALGAPLFALAIAGIMIGVPH